jgi:hypothetical protein
VPPIGSERLAIEAAILLETTDEISSIVPNALQPGFRGIPGVKEDILWATAQAVPGIAEELQGQRILGGATFAPELHAQGIRDLPSVQISNTRERPYTAAALGWNTPTPSPRSSWQMASE